MEKDEAGIVSRKAPGGLSPRAKRSGADIEETRKNLEGTHPSATERMRHTMTMKRRTRLVLPPGVILRLSRNSPLRASRGTDSGKQLDLPFPL